MVTLTDRCIYELTHTIYVVLVLAWISQSTGERKRASERGKRTKKFTVTMKNQYRFLGSFLCYAITIKHFSNSNYYLLRSKCLNKKKKSVLTKFSTCLWFIKFIWDMTIWRDKREAKMTKSKRFEILFGRSNDLVLYQLIRTVYSSPAITLTCNRGDRLNTRFIEVPFTNGIYFIIWVSKMPLELTVIYTRTNVISSFQFRCSEPILIVTVLSKYVSH